MDRIAPRNILFCFLIIVAGLVIVASNPLSVSANNGNPENTLKVIYSPKLDNLSLEAGHPQDIEIHFNSTWNEKLWVEMSDNAEGTIRVEYPPKFYIQPDDDKDVSFRVYPQMEGDFNVVVRVRVRSSHIAPGQCCGATEIIHEENIVLKGNVTLPPGVEPPNADAGGPYSGKWGETIELDGTRSSDPDGTIERYSWMIMEDPTGGHVYLMGSDTATPILLTQFLESDAVITVKLVVVDDDGIGGSDVAYVTILASENKENNEIENAATTYYIYGARTCGACVMIKDKLTDLYGKGSVRFFDTLEDPNGFYFHNIYGEVFPGEVELEPLVGVFVENELIAVTGGFQNEYLEKSFWEGLETYPSPTAVYGGKKSVISDPEKARALFLQEAEPDVPSVERILIPFLAAAAVDSVNPCTFAVFIVLLTLISLKREKVLRSGLFFIAAIFICYFMFGLGLKPLFGAFPGIKYVVGAFGIFVGSVQISNFLGKHKVSLVPGGARVKVRSMLEKVASPWGAFGVGVFCSVFLLPCTSGPYFIAINFIAQRAFLAGIPLLLLYNAIFVLPLLGILFAVHKLSVTTGRVKRWWGERERVVDLLTGVLIILLSAYLIFFF